MNELNVKRLAVFGGSGKLGTALINHYLAAGLQVRALVHRTPLAIEHPGLECLPGDVRNPADVAAVVAGAEAVLCLATAKEDPDTFFDVSLKGTFNILEACRHSADVRQVILAGGDAAVGIWFYPHPAPIDETHPLMAYPGYYAFSKVMEEVMLNQYHIQYGLPGTILRMSWIFTGQDILNHLSLRNLNPAEKGHGWDDYLTDDHRALIARGENRVPILVNEQGVPYTRHIVHLQDVIHAFDQALGNPATVGETFNISGPRAFCYDQAAAYLSSKNGLATTEITAAGYHSFEIDITKARQQLGYAPRYDIEAIIDAALAEGSG
jgi:nucleoside-diphosphate-sugar epimerase